MLSATTQTTKLCDKSLCACCCLQRRESHGGVFDQMSLHAALCDTHPVSSVTHDVVCASRFIIMCYCRGTQNCANSSRCVSKNINYRAACAVCRDPFPGNDVVGVCQINSQGVLACFPNRDCTGAVHIGVNNEKLSTALRQNCRYYSVISQYDKIVLVD